VTYGRVAENNTPGLQSARFVRIVLKAVAIVIAAGSVALIFGGKSLILRAAAIPGLPETELSAEMLTNLKEFGGLFLLVSLLIWLAAADPVRNVAIIDALVVGFVVLAIVPVFSRYVLSLGLSYPPAWTWIRTFLRLSLAGLLFLLRISSGANRNVA